MVQEQSKKNRSFVGGAVVLGIAGLLIKLLGAAFRIPLTNIIGDDGMGYYQTAYPIYVFFLTIATAGIPIAISRMVAERNAIDKPWEAYRVFKVSFILLFCIGISSSSLLFFGAEAISAHMKEPRAIYAMRAVAPALLLCPLMASFRGFFQGRQNMNPTASSQVIEQVFRVAAGLGLAVFFMPAGKEFAAAGASFGATAGGFFGLIGIVIIYLRKKGEIGEELAAAPKSFDQSAGSILKDILIIAIPITVGSSIMPIINVIDAALVKSRLIEAGYASDVARSMYGQLTGMAGPVINFPQVLTQAVSMSLVPVIASAYKRKEEDFLRHNIRLGLRLALMISIPSAVGMMVLARPIMLMFYPYQRESAISASKCLVIFAAGVVFLAIVQTLTGVLQGIGKQLIPVGNLCAGAAVKVVITYILTGIPAINVRGAAIGTVTAYLIAAVLNFVSVRKYTGVKVNFNLAVLRPLFSAIIMGAAAFGAYKFMRIFAGNMISTFTAILLGAFTYFVMVFVTGTLTFSELESLPYGKKVAFVLEFCLPGLRKR